MTTTGGKIKLEEGTGGGDYVGFKAPDSNIDGDVIWTLPDVDGEPGQVLGTDGFGNLEWVTVPNFLLYDVNKAYTGYSYSGYYAQEAVPAGYSKMVTSYTGSKFIGWNTKADGTGVWYYPGQPLVMPAHTLILYAQKSSSSY